MTAATLRKRLSALFTVLVCVSGANLHAQAPLPETLPMAFERAEFLPLRSLRPPPDDASWQPVTLPDNWYISHPDTNSGGWYRIVLPLTTVPRRVHAVFLPRGSGSVVRAFINGNIVGSTFQQRDMRARLNQQAAYFSAPPAVFREGRNVLHIYIDAQSDLRQGLTRVWFGDGPLMRGLWMERFQKQVILAVAFAFAVVAIGLLALAMWLRTRKDAAFLWFGLGAVLLGLPAILNFFFEHSMPAAWRDVLYLAYSHAHAPALALGALHMADGTSRRVTAALWGMLFLGCLMPLVLSQGAYPWLNLTLGLLFLVILIVAFSRLFARRGVSSVKVRSAAAAALITAILFAGHDLSLWMGWFDYDNFSLLPFAAPVVTFALAVLLVSRHLDVVHGLAVANATLERRVDERTTEIEHTHEQLRILERERTRVGERQRIMADIHDGLGASLVSLLSIVQSRGAKLEDIERRVHDALVELRLAVDSQDTPEGDLLTALATIRFRMRDALEASGIELDWDVTDVPPLDQLSSANLLGIQRIVLEALTNAIRHAHAKRVTVSLASADGHVVVFIVDDGRGFDAAALSRAGRGLASMRRRADNAGGSLRIESAPGRGTRVVLTLPAQPHPPAA